MKSNSLIPLASVFAILSAAGAQAQLCQEWEQCGGIGWRGSTTCASGLTCTVLSPYYSQCIRSSTTSTSSAASSSPTAKFKTWFSFGDSYTSTGFIANGTQPNRGNPFGNPPYPGDTICGEVPNWIDYDATTYNTTFVEVFNYAVSGATIDNNLVPAYSLTVPSVTDQVNSFLSYQAPGKPDYNGWSAQNTLVSVWIGINDIGNSYNLAGKGVGYNNVLLNRYFQLMQSLYAAGARHFLFLTVPPVYRTPYMAMFNSTDRAEEKIVIDDYNIKLPVHAGVFALSNPGVTYQIYDTTPIFNTILNNPTAYGFQDATSYGDGNTYAWCNVYHPSPPFHNQIAKQVATLIAGRYT